METPNSSQENSNYSYRAIKYFLGISGVLVAGGLALGMYLHRPVKQDPIPPRETSGVITLSELEKNLKDIDPITVECGRDIITISVELGKEGVILQKTVFGRK